jgi:hypothetical protein
LILVEEQRASNLRIFDDSVQVSFFLNKLLMKLIRERNGNHTESIDTDQNDMIFDN